MDDETRALIRGLHLQVSALATLSGYLIGALREEGLLGPGDEEQFLSSLEGAAGGVRSPQLTAMLDLVRQASAAPKPRQPPPA